MTINMKLVRSPWVSGVVALAIWGVLFLFTDFTTTTVVEREGREAAVENAPTEPMSWQELERRTEEARRLIQEQIEKDRNRIRSDPFYHVRSKSVIWTWIPWSLCVLIFGLRSISGFFAFMSTCAVLILPRLISFEAFLVTACVVLVLQQIRYLVVKAIRRRDNPTTTF